MTYDLDLEAKRIVDALKLEGATMTLICALREAYEAGVEDTGCAACDREGATAGGSITDLDYHTCGTNGEKLLFMAGWCAGFQEALTDDRFPEVDRSEVAWLQFLSERENG